MTKSAIETQIITLGQIVTFIALSSKIFSSLKSILDDNLTLQENEVILKRYLDFDEQIKKVSKKGIHDFNIEKIELQNLNYGYLPDEFVLKDINLKIKKGEKIKIEGQNGSGKSTLLNIIDKSLSVTTGDLQINGEVSHIAIGAGLKIDLTGRDNIRLKGTMMGMSKKEIDDKMEEIIQFSELGPFIDRQVKDYSSGMRSKLAFSIAVNQDPDILIIDEALSVGDSTFAAKSSKRCISIFLGINLSSLKESKPCFRRKHHQFGE